MKKIIIPVDFSTSSEHASKLASKIARLSKSEIHLLHMIEVPKGLIDQVTNEPLATPQNILYIKKTKELLDSFQEKFFFKNKKVVQAILFNKPSEGILSYAEKINSDLIVMGSKGHTKIEELIIGSNTYKIIQTSKTPVLVVKKDESKFRLKNLIYASDFDETKKHNNALNKLIDFAKLFKSTFHLVKVNTPSSFENTQTSNEKMKRFAEKYNLDKHTINIQNDSTIEDGIINFTNEIQGDIIALESYGRSAVSHLFNRSITKHVSEMAKSPTIIFKT